jgi:hypothetical protein
MPTHKSRVTVNLDPRAYETISRLAAVSGDSMSQIVAQFLDVALPSMGRLVVVL